MKIAPRLMIMQQNPPILRLGLLLVSELVMLSAAIIWPIAWLRAHGCKDEPGKRASQARSYLHKKNICYILLLVNFSVIY